MRSLALILTIAAGLFVPAGAGAQLSFLGIKNSLVQFALEQINVPGSLEITVENVEDVADGATDLVGLAVADGDGVWLRIERVSMGWVPSRLLEGELAITKLVADKVQVLRAPKPGPDEAPVAEKDEGPVEIKWPRAPLTVVVEGLRLNGVSVAAGVAGDQPLAFDADGSLRDEGDEQTASFNLTRTDDVAGDIRLDYRRDFKTETLRLSLDANEAAGGLVAALAGLPPGSAAEVHLTGDGPVLEWHGDLTADIGNMAKVEGKIAIPSVQPAQVRLDVRAVAQGEMRETGAPLLDDPVDLKLDVLADPAGLVTLHVLEVKASLGTVAAKGTFDTIAGRLDMAVDAEIPTLGEPLLPGADVQGLNFAGRVSGLVEELQAVGKLRIAKATTDAAMVGGLAVDADVRVSPGKVGFAIKGNAAKLLADRLNMTEGGPVTLDVAGVLDGERLTLEKADVASALLTASASGEADLGGGMVNLDYKAEASDLAPVATAYDAVAGGAFLVEGQVSGKLQEPLIEGIAALRQLSLDGKPIGDVELQHNVTLGEAISGTAVVRAVTKPYGKVSADTAFRLQGDQLTVSKLQANGLGVSAGSKGPVTVDLASTLVEGLLQWKAASLEGIGRVAGTALAGAGNGSLKLHLIEGKQAADLVASIARLRAGDAAIESVKLEAAVRDVLDEMPGLRAKVKAQGVAAGGVELPVVNATANGTLKALNVKADLAGTAPDGKAIVADLVAKLGLAGATQTVRLTRLEASYDKEKISLAKPLTVTVKGSAVNAKGLKLLVPGGEVAGDAALSGNRLRGKLLIALKDLSRLAKMAGAPVQAGALEAQAVFDTRRSATLRATLTGLVSDELPADAVGLNASVSADWDGKQANAYATLEGGFGDPVQVTAGVALKPSRGLLPLPKPDAPLRGTVKWAGRMESLWAMVPAPDHYLEGRADVDLIIGGTVGEPTVAGKAELTDGRYENLETGTILADLTATSEVAADGGFVVTATGNDGATSPVTARVAIAGGKLDASVSTKQAILIRRPDLEATVTADITAKGPLLGPTLAGDVLVDRAEVRLVHPTPPNIATLGEVRIKGAPQPRVKPAKDSPIQLDIRVYAPRNIFVRGRGLDSEWKMDLAVSGNSSKPKVKGSIEKLRGQLLLVGKAFEVDTGRIFFSGATRIDPGLDVKLLRDNDGIRGGIAVSGNASDIQIDFVSTPALPQGEVMPRVLFGRSRQSLSGLEALQLASGIATLMDGSGGTVDQVRGAIGLDVLRVEDKGDGTSVTVGKNVQDGVFIGASQPLDGSSPSVRIEIDVFDNLAIESDLGSQGGSSIGVKWKKDF